MNAKLNSSDRAKLECRVPVLDGIFGTEMEVVATDEGLELGGYATLSWKWIDSARRIVQPSDEQRQPLQPASRIADDGRATAS